MSLRVRRTVLSCFLLSLSSASGCHGGNDSAKDKGDGDGDAVGDGDGDHGGDGDGDRSGDGDGDHGGDGDGDASGDGDGDRSGDGDGDGDASGDGDGDGDASGDGDGDGTGDGDQSGDGDTSGDGDALGEGGAPGDGDGDGDLGGDGDGDLAGDGDGDISNPELTSCEAGTYESGQETSGAPICTVCQAGTFCAGGEAGPSACAAGTWDHDGDAATDCVAQTTCVPGEVVAAAGDAVTNRTCDACVDGYSEIENATQCETFSPCLEWGIAVEGDATKDAVCLRPIDLVARQAQTCAVFNDGSLRCWGRIPRGTGPSATTQSRAFPVLLTETSDVVEVTMGYGVNVVRHSDGSVDSWGTNGRGECGNTTNGRVPAAVDGLGPQTELSYGYRMGCAKSAAGVLSCWGWNIAEQHFDGCDDDVCVPAVAIAGLGVVEQFSVSSGHTCAVLDDKTARCWGTNAGGQLGGASLEWSPTPVVVEGLTDVEAIQAGNFHTCALMGGGTVKCWGLNDSGQVGANSPSNTIRTPTSVTGLSGVTAIDASENHTCALLQDATVKCWGANDHGQLGDSSKTFRRTPVPVQGLSDVEVITAGDSHSCALKTDGTVWCWGYNIYGQLGNRSTEESAVPVKVLPFAN